MIMKKMLLIALAIILVIAVGLSIFLLFHLKGSNYVYQGNSIYEVDYQPQNQYASYKNDLIITTTTETIAINNSGKVIWQIPTTCVAPKLQVSGNYILVADINGQNIYVIKDGNILYEKTLDNTIFNAHINESGFLAVSTAADGFASQITVYNASGTETYYYSISDSIAIDGVVSPDNHSLAVSLYGTDSGQVTSTIAFIDMGKQAIMQKPSYTNIAISNIYYNSNGCLFAVGDTAAIYFDKNGKYLWTSKYNSQVLVNFVFNKNNGFSLILKNTIGTATVKNFNFNNKEINEKDLDFYPQNITQNNSSVLLAGQRMFVSLGKSGKLSGNKSIQKDYTYICVSQNGKYFYGISGNTIELIKI